MHYHAHVYWSTPEQRAQAVTLREPLAKAGASLGRVWDQPIGPHPLPMYQVNYSDSIKPLVERCLDDNGLSVLLHEDTGDDLRDHTLGARWLGNKLTLDLEWLENYVKERNDEL